MAFCTERMKPVQARLHRNVGVEFKSSVELLNGSEGGLRIDCWCGPLPGGPGRLRVGASIQKFWLSRIQQVNCFVIVFFFLNLECKHCVWYGDGTKWQLLFQRWCALAANNLLSIVYSRHDS